MKFSDNWLRTWVNPTLTSIELSEQLTLAGLETSVTPLTLTPFSGVWIGQVNDVLAHPNADQLKICQVAIEGQKELFSIICGAHNVRAGLHVAVALPGAVLSQGFKIKERKLRGVLSQGMLCSMDELGLNSLYPDVCKEKEIWELPQEFPLGQPLWDVLDLSPRWEVQVTPNRSDCLSLLGMAREISALNQVPFSKRKIDELLCMHDTVLPIHIKESQACPRYVGRILRHLNVNTPTPFWMQERLRSSGIRPLNIIVDITNYVMLEYGGPLHAFDLSQLSGQLRLRFATAGERLTLLNHKEVTLNENTLVLADDKNVHALAGIMGGLASAIHETTVDIFLESAFFNPEVIAGQARYYGVMTESSYRFERGVDPEICLEALKRATELFVTLCHAQPGPITQIEDPQYLPQLKTIPLNLETLHKRLGLALTESTILAHLNALDIVLVAKLSQRVWQLQPPSWRFDLNADVDLIEEIARLHGYDQLPFKLPVFPVAFHKKEQEALQALKRLRCFWADQGYHETIHYSFTSQKKSHLLTPDSALLSIKNPMSSELNVLRNSLWPGLLETVAYNQHRQKTELRFFEIGPVFLSEKESLYEPLHVAGVIAGQLLPEQWGMQSRNVDFFDVKNSVQNCLNLLDPDSHYRYQSTVAHAALHPGQSSQLFKNDQSIGWIGALHPKLYLPFELNGPVFLFEWVLEPHSKRAMKPFEAFSSFPSMRRDLAFWISSETAFDTLLPMIQHAAGVHLKTCSLFDVYRPQGSQRHSLAISLVWQHLERTLTEVEVDHWQQQVISVLQKEYQIELRGEN